MTVVSTVKKPPPLTSSAPCFSFSTSVRGWVSISYWSMSNQPFDDPDARGHHLRVHRAQGIMRLNMISASHGIQAPHHPVAESSTQLEWRSALHMAESSYCSCVRVNQPKKISSFSAQWKMNMRKSHDHLRSITFGLLGQSQKLPAYEVNRGVGSTCLNTHIARFSFLGSAERLSMVVVSWNGSYLLGSLKYPTRSY